MDVTPEKQNLDKVFSSTTYFIDFYQRQYKWGEEPVSRLLDDIFYKFNQQYLRFHKSSIDLDKLIESYPWYYLNTYVTNVVDGKTFVVDGQQRLTTLTLILINLYQIARYYNSRLKDWILTKIAGSSGFKKEFWMNHLVHNQTLSHLMEGDSVDLIDSTKGITTQNMLNNYVLIDKYLKKEIGDEKKFEAFAFFFLRRIVLINLNVEQTDVPMVFEVINDRGVRLKPHEILKGKLLGQVQKDELDALGLNEMWDETVKGLSDARGNEDEIDEFFIYYLRSKFANTVAESRKIDRNYHRSMFEDSIEGHLHLSHNPDGVKAFLRKDFSYFTGLYRRFINYYMVENSDHIHVYYNGLTEMDSQFLLVLSACRPNDPEEDEKIKIISYEVDRLFVLLQLQRSYDSNAFNLTTYRISQEIREKPKDHIRKAFDACLLDLLSNARGTTAREAFSYGMFRDTGMELEKRFKRYFFARIETFISSKTNMGMRHSLYDLVSNTGTVNGFHIEHILADNDESLKAFNNDPELFEKERNRLGGLLLLKGKDNISSNAEPYKDKLKTYANTLYWNETLRKDTYTKKKDFSSMMESYSLSFRPMDSFGPNELEERQKLLFEMSRIIWA